MFESMFKNQTRYIRVNLAGHQTQLFASIRAILSYATRIGITDTAELEMLPAGFDLEWSARH